MINNTGYINDFLNEQINVHYYGNAIVILTTKTLQLDEKLSVHNFIRH